MNITNPMLGRFVEKTAGNWFEYKAGPSAGDDSSSEWAQYNMEIDVGGNVDWGWRHAKVLKTVAYVVVDEAADGSPVVEKWDIKQHVKYTS